MSTIEIDEDPSNGDYGVCLTCGERQKTRDDAHEHMRKTFEERPKGSDKGHSVRTLNPTSDQRAASRVGMAVERAQEEFCDDIWRDIERGDITAAQVTEALKSFPDFQDAWAEYAEEMGVDEDDEPEDDSEPPVQHVAGQIPLFGDETSVDELTR